MTELEKFLYANDILDEFKEEFYRDHAKVHRINQLRSDEDSEEVNDVNEFITMYGNDPNAIDYALLWHETDRGETFWAGMCDSFIDIMSHNKKEHRITGKDGVKITV